MSDRTFQPFESLLGRVREGEIERWRDLEAEFLSATEHFDEEYRAGNRETGWYQSKARYFNDIVVGLLVNNTHCDIAARAKKDSHLFGKIDIDICCPKKGEPLVAGETKALGTPPHPRNKNKGRPGSQDLHKRIREVAFTSMDLKAAYAKARTISSFQGWIDSTEPGYFSFWAVRVDTARDLERVREMLSGLRNYCNGVGAVIYGPTDPTRPVSYVVHTVPHLSMDAPIREMAQRIVGRPDRA
ncbi:MAG: hypothetical protein ABR538_14875 [Candidatus Binatia bacterium]